MRTKGWHWLVFVVLAGCGGAARHARQSAEIARTYGEAAVSRATADLSCALVHYDYLGAGGVRAYGCEVGLTYTCTTTIVSGRHDVVCVPQGQPAPYTPPPPSALAASGEQVALRETLAPCQLAPGTLVSFYIGVEADLLDLQVPDASAEQRACVERAITTLGIAPQDDAQHFEVEITPPAPAAPAGPAPPVGGGPVGAEATARTMIDTAASAIVACAGGGAVAVVGEWTADGALTVRLPDARAGTPEDGCVRAAGAGLRIDPPPGTPGMLLHAVQ